MAAVQWAGLLSGLASWVACPPSTYHCSSRPGPGRGRAPAGSAVGWREGKAAWSAGPQRWLALECASAPRPHPLRGSTVCSPQLATEPLLSHSLSTPVDTLVPRTQFVAGGRESVLALCSELTFFVDVLPGCHSASLHSVSGG